MFGRSSPPRRSRSMFLQCQRLEERATPAALTPAQVRQAYGFSQVAAVNGTSLTGAGETIAIIDAYNDPYITSDLATFDAKYGLSSAEFQGRQPDRLGQGTPAKQLELGRRNLIGRGMGPCDRPGATSCWSRPIPATPAICSRP